MRIISLPSIIHICHMRHFITDLKLIQTEQAMILPYLLILAVLYVSHSLRLSLFACKYLDAQQKLIFSGNYSFTPSSISFEISLQVGLQAWLFWIDINIFPHIKIEVALISTSKLTFTFTDKMKLNLILVFLFFSRELNLGILYLWCWGLNHLMILIRGESFSSSVNIFNCQWSFLWLWYLYRH